MNENEINSLTEAKHAMSKRPLDQRKNSSVNIRKIKQRKVLEIVLRTEILNSAEYACVARDEIILFLTREVILIFTD